jgi:hypothetical protein
MTAVPPSDVTPSPLSPINVPERGVATAFIVYVLLLISLFTGGLSALLGMILAYDRKAQAGPVTATHFGFQLKIFWICFALSLTAGALWISGLISLLIHTVLPGPALHAQPDAQLVQIAAPALGWADFQTWTYRSDIRPLRLSGAAGLQFWLGFLCLSTSVLISWTAPIWGILRLAAGLPIGRVPA